MLSLLANVGPPLYPTPDAPVSEWAVWGGCIGVAAVLGGWALFNRSRPNRKTRVRFALVGALVLAGFATSFVIQRDVERKIQRSRQLLQELERKNREAEEQSQH